MTKQLTISTTAILLGLLVACGGHDDRKTDDQPRTTIEAVATDSEAERKPLVDDDVAAPDGFTFERKDLAGIGTIEMPSGQGWTVEGDTYYNELLDMTVKVQSQASGNLDVVDEYTQSYVDNNHRDAPNYKETNRESGQVNGYVATMVAGNFNNGQPYSTKDYLFFTADKTVVLQARINEKNDEKLEPVIDHIVSTLKK